MSDGNTWEYLFGLALNVYAIVFFALMWISYFIILVYNVELLDRFYLWVDGLPLLAEIIVWILLLPATIGLSVRQSTRPPAVKLIVFILIIGWTILAIYNMNKFVVDNRVTPIQG
ncbi:MAG: hypothetical protein ACXAE3_10995 [Candidatus Kariarchaeaceae archaeon]|jgi:hypothetical protein